MALPPWPVTLPSIPLISGYDEQLPILTIRTPMAAGPSKTRRLVSRNSRFVSVKLILTQSQIVIFEEFFLDTILGGALEFTWVHPRTQSAVICRIVADESNKVMYRFASNELTEVSFMLEILP